MRTRAPTHPAAQQALLSEREIARPGARSIAIELDGHTLRTIDGDPIAILTDQGWTNPQGITTSWVEIELCQPTARVSDRDLSEHERHQDELWLQHALEVLRALAHEMETFTVDDVWAKITMPPRDARLQMSRLMRGGAREGLMRLTAQTRPCIRNKGGRRVRVWRSLVATSTSAGAGE